MALAACSTSSTPGMVNGNIRNTHFAVADTIAMVGTSGVEIAMSSEAGACGSTVQHPGETALLLVLPGVTPGTYPVTDAMGAVAEGNILDAQCLNNADNDAVADSGTVTLTKVDSGVFFGTFDLTFGSEQVTGNFTAITCTAPNVTDPACEP